MRDMSIKEKENTLKLNDISGLSCTTTGANTIGEDLQSEFSRSIVLFSTFGSTPVGQKSTILPRI